MPKESSSFFTNSIPMYQLFNNYNFEQILLFIGFGGLIAYIQCKSHFITQLSN